MTSSSIWTASAPLSTLPEQLRSRKGAVDDVEVHRGGEHDDEERGESEVRDQCPAGRGFAEDFFDVREKDSQFTSLPGGRLVARASSASVALMRSTKTSSSEDRTGVSS